MTARDGPAGSRPARPGRPACTPDLIATLAGRLTARDRWLLRMLHEHRVLTSAQITQLAFGTTRAATARLLILHRYRTVDRFRPLARRGSAPWHFVLGEAGARVLAAEDRVSLTQLGYRRDRALDIAVSPQLAHATGANGFFTALAASARAGHGRLACWWGERRCAALWGDLARPDGYARWRGHGGGQPAEAEFFLEYDTGTEDLPRLAGKLAGYRMLAQRTGIITPVLFWLPGPRREAAMRTGGYGIDGDHDGVVDVYDPGDAVPSAASYLRANGAPGDIQAALFAYNHSWSYVTLVLGWAARYAAAGSAVPAVSGPGCELAARGAPPGGAAGKVIAYAEAQLGKPYEFSQGPGGQLMIGSYVCPAQSSLAGSATSATGVVHAGLDLAQRCAALQVVLYAADQLGKPYQWGATGPDAFDCSGLTMMAYRAAGVYILRTSQQQWAFGPRVAPSAVEPGDLVFFAGSDGTLTAPGHVGIVIGQGLMIDAPFTGAEVRIEPYTSVPGLVGFTRPG